MNITFSLLQSQSRQFPASFTTYPDITPEEEQPGGSSNDERSQEQASQPPYPSTAVPPWKLVAEGVCFTTGCRLTVVAAAHHRRR